MTSGKRQLQYARELRRKSAVDSADYWGFSMGPAYFVIAILGCADGGTSCTPVATLETHYATQAQCSAATSSALEENSNFDFPTLLARCRVGTSQNSADAQRSKSQATRVRRA